MVQSLVDPFSLSNPRTSNPHIASLIRRRAHHEALEFVEGGRGRLSLEHGVGVEFLVEEALAVVGGLVDLEELVRQRPVPHLFRRRDYGTFQVTEYDTIRSDSGTIRYLPTYSRATCLQCKARYPERSRSYPRREPRHQVSYPCSQNTSNGRILNLSRVDAVARRARLEPLGLHVA